MPDQTETECPACVGTGKEPMEFFLKPGHTMQVGSERDCQKCGGKGSIAQEGDRNYPVIRTCPHCGDADAMLMPPLGYYSEYHCQHCGTYRVTGTMEELIANRTVNP